MFGFGISVADTLHHSTFSFLDLFIMSQILKAHNPNESKTKLQLLYWNKPGIWIFLILFFHYIQWELFFRFFDVSYFVVCWGLFYPQHAHFSVMSILSLIISHKSFSEKLLAKYLFSHNMKLILTALCNLYFPLLNFFPFFNSLMDFHGCMEFKLFLSNIVVISPFVQKGEDPRSTQYRMKYILGEKKNLFSNFLSWTRSSASSIKAILSCDYGKGIIMFWNDTKSPKCTWI